ncbi:MAG: hypothetical protein KDI39_06480 [Pseudomonadales bacterium]|nr:hypothetical protein [Pseudomonadales bacterium]
MTHIKEWLTDLALLPETHLENFQPCCIKATSVTLSEKDVDRKLKHLGKVTGWLQETGRVITLDKQSISCDSFPMSGEFCAEHIHYILKYIGRNEWQLDTFVYQACQASEASHLAEKIQHRMVGAKNKKSLMYWRLWEAESELSPAPVVRIALFAGFVE